MRGGISQTWLAGAARDQGVMGFAYGEDPFYYSVRGVRKISLVK
jgi:hypothetical protein